ncbi:aldo/keto reductase [Actinomadura darangshiensis]|uniref:Aldo/keto reductase n=1 Tax=Actinomadura darangshiensis TaxID=705336 RepID=A0A4R5B2P3_9ACTN|nr:aldo/keto reductase [Actinomadura darangshiensis]TDD79263.1 aldo/keto reductase [Actinomadura darangshiensis]
MQTITLNNGVQMPVLGFGVFQIPPEQTEQAVTDALAAGYRKFDTAAAYRNEEAVGRALKNSGIPREELFITTKPWVQDVPAEDNTKRASETSLTRLGLDYLDLYLMHQPFGDAYAQWRAMQDLYRQGRAKAIGISNFYPDRMSANLAVFDFELTGDQMDQIAALDTGASLYFDHRDPAMVSQLGSRRID